MWPNVATRVTAFSGYRPQCADARATGEPHDIDGSHYARCREHHQQHKRWRKARNTHVARAAARAAENNQPFDQNAAVLAREKAKPWLPGLVGDRALGVIPIRQPDVRRLRTTVAELLDAKLPVDTAHREGEDLTTKQLNRLLTAIEKHAALVNSILKTSRR